jgi:hypothetical protein
MRFGSDQDLAAVLCLLLRVFIGVFLRRLFVLLALVRWRERRVLAGVGRFLRADLVLVRSNLRPRVRSVVVPLLRNAYFNFTFYIFNGSNLLRYPN